MLGDGPQQGPSREIRNPAHHRDLVGLCIDASVEQVEAALSHAVSTAPIWQSTPPADRAADLLRAADLMEQRMNGLMGLIVREAGKSLPADVKAPVELVTQDVAAKALAATPKPFGSYDDPFAKLLGS